jgi:heterodisulfide reductase subunit A-like polyferredoxin
MNSWSGYGPMERLSMDKANLSDGARGSVLVVGAGIAGMQSSLDLANSGYYVYLLDKNISIGGVMAQLDKTFPTNDCSTCMISPKLIEVASNPNIEIISRAELLNLDGVPGDFKAKVRERTPLHR